MAKVLIVALGGNALIKPGQSGKASEQFVNLRSPMKQIAKLSDEYHIVITHGNGPQVGNLLIQQESTNLVQKMPMAILVAETQGQIGYMIECTLDEELMRLGSDDEKLFLTILTYVQVDPEDPAFKNPTKPVGPSYAEPQPGFVKTAKGWRRVVPSPKPQKIIQWREIQKLMQYDFIVITCGGGGIPVVKKKKNFHGVEAVIDKDLASALLAEEIDADILLIATDVDKVSLNYQKPDQIDLDVLTIKDAKKYMKEGQFPPGSMLPKVQAAINFLEYGGERAIITSTDKIEAALRGKAGTEVIR
ncbi:MAG: carbamate kinase [archaeon]|nr:carbamate kinase [archaeon]